MMKISTQQVFSLIIQLLFSLVRSEGGESSNTGIALHSIEGKVIIEEEGNSNWLSETLVVAGGGKYKGYLQQNGAFVINRVPPGSYLVEVVSPNYVFEPVRVDISSKSGKLRARKENHTVASNVVKRLQYPLVFKTNETANFFEKRETLFTQIAKNPGDMFHFALFAIAVLSIPLIMVLHTMLGDSEELQNVQLPMLGSFPSLEEIITTVLSGGSLKELFASYFEADKKAPSATSNKAHLKRPKKKRQLNKRRRQ